MASTALETIIAWCERQVGTKEQPPGSNNVVYNTIYYGGPVSGSAYPWCCAFLWCAFSETGLSALFCGGQKTAYCPFVVDYAKRHDQWITRGYRPGDIVFFDWNKDGLADHIGIVVSVLGSALTTIEGNVNEAVCRLDRSELGVMGGYRPEYGASAPPEDTPVPDPAEDSGETYTVKYGDTLWAIAEKTGVPITELARINSISNVNLIYEGMVLRLKADAPDGTPAAAPEEDELVKIAREVIRGSWGNGLARVARLTAAGYSYKAVQAKVNEILRG